MMNASVCHAFWTYCPVPDIVVQKTRMATMSHGHVHIGDGYKHGGYGRDDRGYGFRGPRYECGSRQVTVVWTCPACGCGGRGKGLQTWSSWKLGYGNSCREGYGDDGNRGFVMMPVLQLTIDQTQACSTKPCNQLHQTWKQRQEPLCKPHAPPLDVHPVKK